MHETSRQSLPDSIDTDVMLDYVLGEIEEQGARRTLRYVGIVWTDMRKHELYNITHSGIRAMNCLWPE